MVGYYQFYDSNLSAYLCYPCKDANCLYCYSSNYGTAASLCYECKSGYAHDYSVTRGCYNISITNCKSFWYGSKNQTLCATCIAGYIRNSGYTQCLLCTVANCATCKVNNGSVCAVCKNGYYGDYCKPNCTLHCSAGCLTPFTCTSCDQGYSGSDCSIVNCDVNNCDMGCTLPNVCDSCDAGYTGSTCS